ncbi:MAG: hypothetical protein D6754_06580 [Alphaproteobacteria bacterium]|nr:MAG: hypothetical protein D6754_06580 [Alphaproteobacteria bacterium]
MVENRAGRRICIIHAGMPKTGSSALQSFLARGARRLRRRGMLYPRTGLTWSSPPAAMTC